MAMTVTNMRGEEFELTPNEEKFFKALKRLEKIDQGRLDIFCGGTGFSLRINDNWHDDEVAKFNIRCEGGDGGDNF